ncbi:MAG: hypothetical protein ACRC7O_00115 [Fimbriiglobus sp.]
MAKTQPAVKTPDNTTIVSSSMEKLLKMVHARTADLSYGEVVLRFVFENGKIKTAKMIEETVTKPPEFGAAERSGR